MYTNCFRQPYVRVRFDWAHQRNGSKQNRILGSSGLSANDDFGYFRVGFGVWEALQSIGNGCGLQMDGFSPHFEPYEFIFEDFQDFTDFPIVSDGLTLFPKVPGP